MSNFGREDVNALFSLVPLVFWQLYNPPVNRNYGEAYSYERQKHQVRFAPPAWVFPVAWTLMYGLIIASGFIFFRDYQDGTGLYLATAVIYLTNIMLNKYWSVVFFRGTVSARRYALLIMIVLVLTGGAVVLLEFLAGASLPAFLYSVYMVWLLFAMYLNVKWLYIPSYVPGKASHVQQQQQQKGKKAPIANAYKSMRSTAGVPRALRTHKQETTVTTTRTFMSNPSAPPKKPLQQQQQHIGLPRFVIKHDG